MSIIKTKMINIIAIARRTPVPNVNEGLFINIFLLFY